MLTLHSASCTGDKEPALIPRTLNWCESPSDQDVPGQHIGRTAYLKCETAESTFLCSLASRCSGTHWGLYVEGKTEVSASKEL